jgi:DNA-binding response OmpR family regulator
MSSGPSLIVLVEDNFHEAELFKAVIRKMGSSAFLRVFSSASDALKDIMKTGANDFPVSLFVLDISLPDGDGAQIYDALQAHDSLHSVPVAFLTHLPNRRSIELSSENSQIKLFRKPGTLNGYYTVISEIIAHANYSSSDKVA